MNKKAFVVTGLGYPVEHTLSPDTLPSDTLLARYPTLWIPYPWDTVRLYT